MLRLHRNVRTLSLGAAAMVVAVAVPALASDALTAHSAARCSNKRGSHVRCVFIRGPRGPRGLRGFTGPAGPRGKTGPAGPRGRTGATGTTGATGPAGPAGTARAFAVVQPAGVGATTSSAGLVAAQTSNVPGIRRAAPGTYCITPGTGIDPTHDAASVTGEQGYSTGANVVPIAVINALHPACLPSEFEVQTYDGSNLGVGPTANNVAFEILIA